MLKFLWVSSGSDMGVVSGSTSPGVRRCVMPLEIVTTHTSSRTIFLMPSMILARSLHDSAQNNDLRFPILTQRGYRARWRRSGRFGVASIAHLRQRHLANVGLRLCCTMLTSSRTPVCPRLGYTDGRC